MASTTGFGSVSQGSNPCGTTTPAGAAKARLAVGSFATISFSSV